MSQFPTDRGEPATPRPVLVATGVVLALLAFAGNSLLCRLALREDAVDPATFTAVRIAAGAVVLTALARITAGSGGWWRGAGSWAAAAALFVYAAGFSLAYVTLDAGTGALLLFGTVQVAMIGWGVRRGDRLRLRQWLGVLVALGGTAALLLPGSGAPPPGGALLMVVAGVGWAAFSLRGAEGAAPLVASAGNFLRAVAPAVALLAAAAVVGGVRADPAGLGWAVLSGAVTSGLGYAAWYAVLPALRAASAASLQLTVPVLTAVAGVVLLGEPWGVRLVLATVAVVGGVAAVLSGRRPAAGTVPRR